MNRPRRCVWRSRRCDSCFDALAKGAAGQMVTCLQIGVGAGKGALLLIHINTQTLFIPDADRGSLEIVGAQQKYCPSLSRFSTRFHCACLRKAVQNVRLTRHVDGDKGLLQVAPDRPVNALAHAAHAVRSPSSSSLRVTFCHQQHVCSAARLTRITPGPVCRIS